MTDIAASLGIEQLKKLDKFNSLRVKNAKKLTIALSKFRDLKLPNISKGDFNSYYGYAILIKEESTISRKKLVNHLERDGIKLEHLWVGTCRNNLLIEMKYLEYLMT